MLPDWSRREIREVSVLVDYKVDGNHEFVVLPHSNAWMTVLEMETRPGGMRESFLGTERRVYVPAHTRYLQVHCRLKLYARRDRSGQELPWPTAADLFPGATRIRQTSGDEDLEDFQDFEEQQD